MSAGSEVLEKRVLAALAGTASAGFGFSCALFMFSLL